MRLDSQEVSDRTCSVILIPLGPILVFDPVIMGRFVLFSIAREFAAVPVVLGLGVLGVFKAIRCSGIILWILNYGHLHQGRSRWSLWRS